MHVIVSKIIHVRTRLNNSAKTRGEFLHKSSIVFLIVTYGIKGEIVGM